jgi:hypothetical protein
MTRFLAIAIALFGIAGSALASGHGTSTLHDPFDRLLESYVRDDGVRYGAWSESKEDLAALGTYVDALEAVDPDALESDAAFAYWINLYNATTLELVLAHYPVDSIKDIGSLFKSPWKKKLVEVNGEALSLDEIENDIIRKRFSDARFHFALNCASIGCPELLREAYVAEHLDRQLESVTRGALNDPRWVDLSGEEARITKIFDWYREDFVGHSGSVAAFIAAYRDEPAETLIPRLADAKSASYDWALNEATP